MKTTLTWSVALVVALSLGGCKKEGCTSPYAENYDSSAKKDDGSCVLERDKFVGAYTASHTCVYDDPASYTLTVAAGAADNKVVLKNFYGWGGNLEATIDGSTISFNATLSGVVFEGTGYLVGQELTLNFYVCEEFYYPCSDPDNCQMIGTKQ